MRSFVIFLVVAGAAWFGWKKYEATQPKAPAEVQDPNKTPGANAGNRIDNLSGAAPSMP
jgi:hypothetical protein